MITAVWPSRVTAGIGVELCHGPRLRCRGQTLEVFCFATGVSALRPNDINTIPPCFFAEKDHMRSVFLRCAPPDGDAVPTKLLYFMANFE